MWPILAAIGSVVSKALAASKAAAIGLGKGLLGGAQAAGSSPLSLGKTAAPALNASAMKAGSSVGSFLKKKILYEEETPVQRSQGKESEEIDSAPLASSSPAPSVKSVSPLAMNQLPPEVLQELLKKGGF